MKFVSKLWPEWEKLVAELEAAGWRNVGWQGTLACFLPPEKPEAIDAQ